MLSKLSYRLSCKHVRKTIDAALVVKDAIKMYNNRAALVPITPKLISVAHSAYNRYKNHLDMEKELKEQKLKEKEQDKKKYS